MANTGYDDRNIIGLFQALYEDRVDQSWAGKLSLYNGDSDRAEEEYGIFGGFPQMREWVGARQLQTIGKKTFAIRNRPFESSLPVREVDLDRDKTGLLEAYIGDYAEQVPAGHWEDLLIELINNNGVCYDGQNFFDTDHKFSASSSESQQTNEVTATQCPALNVATATSPTAEEAARALLQLVGYQQGFTNDRSRAVNGNAKDFLVMVKSVELHSAILEAVSSQNLSNTVSNPLTGLRMDNVKFEVIRVPSLSFANDTSRVMVFRKDGRLKPFLRQDEKAMEYDMLDRNSDHFKLNKELVMLLDARRGAGYGIWQHAIRGTFS